MIKGMVGAKVASNYTGVKIRSYVVDDITVFNGNCNPQPLSRRTFGNRRITIQAVRDDRNLRSLIRIDNTAVVNIDGEHKLIVESSKFYSLDIGLDIDCIFTDICEVGGRIFMIGYSFRITNPGGMIADYKPVSYLVEIHPRAGDQADKFKLIYNSSTNLGRVLYNLRWGSDDTLVATGVRKEGSEYSWASELVFKLGANNTLELMNIAEVKNSDVPPLTECADYYFWLLYIQGTIPDSSNRTDCRKCSLCSHKVLK